MLPYRSLQCDHINLSLTTLVEIAQNVIDFAAHRSSSAQNVLFVIRPCRQHMTQMTILVNKRQHITIQTKWYYANNLRLLNPYLETSMHIHFEALKIIENSEANHSHIFSIMCIALDVEAINTTSSA